MEIDVKILIVFLGTNIFLKGLINVEFIDVYAYGKKKEAIFSC